MKKLICSMPGCLLALLLLISCGKNDHRESVVPASVSAADLALIRAAGFGTERVQPVKEGFLVEGDILLTHEQLKRPGKVRALRVGEVEQYRTAGQVTGLPRVIRVKAPALGIVYTKALDTALIRYNALRLQLRFVQVASGTADITLQPYSAAPGSGPVIYATTGFPSGGNPYNTILLNIHPAALGTNPNIQFAASIIQHNIGHCIGMYHTDYMNTAFSCGGTPAPVVEGPIWIMGTPAGPDPNSYMLTCLPAGNFTFNANDIIALKYLY